VGEDKGGEKNVGVETGGGRVEGMMGEGTGREREAKCGVRRQWGEGKEVVRWRECWEEWGGWDLGVEGRGKCGRG